MDKKSLLVIVASLMVLSAGAQLKSAVRVASSQPLSATPVRPQVEEMEMQLQTSGDAVHSPNRSPQAIKPYYIRPAGAYYAHQVAENGCPYSLNRGYIQVKPFSDYTFYSVIDGADENDECYWDQFSDILELIDGSSPLTLNYGLETADAPALYVYHGDIEREEGFRYPYYFSLDDYVVINKTPALIYSYPDTKSWGEDEYDILLSSKTMCEGGRYGNLTSLYYAFDGAIPFDTNMYGRWFGKNGGHYDGMAQAFEKPSHPYALKKVCMQIGQLSCEAPVKLSCKVYRLDEIPPYQEEGTAGLPENLGEPIATGYSIVKPDTDETTYGLLTFTLYAHEDGIDYEITPTIDFPILIVIEDYNNPEYDALRDFTCFISADIHVDEGYGELAYLKCPINDEQGNFTGNYEWKGLNNFFNGKEMKTGYSIYIVADMPYLLFSDAEESGEYEFDVAGGEMQKTVDGRLVNGIEFKTSVPDEGETWYMHLKGGEELPEWLDISLEDGESDEMLNGIVTAHVVAQPLPNDQNYREAVVRFEFPGAYLDYKFMQGEQSYPIDPPEEPVATIYKMVKLILSGKVSDEDMKRYDVNKDGELTIADINMVINYVLSHDE